MHNSRILSLIDSIDALEEIVFPYTLLENTYSTLSRKFNTVREKVKQSVTV
jgi:hypothetical protein